MSVETTRPAVRINDAWSAPSRALRLEKPRPTSRLDDESGCARAPIDRRGPRPTRRGESHYGTVDDVSPWHGPRLTTPFAAQVIAQAMEAQAHSAASAGVVYRSHAAQIPHPLLLDAAI
jgi:hypothetical protein